MAAKKGSEFVVRFGNIKFPAAVEKRITAALQNAVLSEVAKLNLKQDFRVRIPRKEWLGIWIERISNVQPPNRIR